jgi:hypothetical protein
MIGITSWRDFGAALVVFILAVAFLFWTQTIPPRATAMPILVAWLMILLALIDLISQTETTIGRLFRRFAAAERIIEWKVEGDEEEAGWGRVLVSILWVCAYLAAVYLAGFLVGTPTYLFLYMVLHGGKSILASTISAIATTFAIWLTFEVLFKYPLYPGVIFGRF